MFKFIIVFFAFFMLAFIVIPAEAAVQSSTDQDVGSCYSVAPICMYPTKPVCVCNYSMNCWWACK